MTHANINNNKNTGAGISDTCAEKAVLACALYKKEFMEYGREYLDVSCFTTPLTRSVYKAIKACEDEGDEICIASVMNVLDRMSDSNVNEEDLRLMISAAEPNEFMPLLRRVKELSTRRALSELFIKSLKAVEDRSEQVEHIIAEALDSLQNIANGQNANLETHTEALDIVRQRMDENRGDGPKRALATGFAYIDDKTGGFQPGQLVVIGAETSQGKSALAQSIMYYQARLESPVRALYISLEMMKEEIAARTVSMQSSVEAKRLLYLPASDEEYAKAIETIEMQKGFPIWYSSANNIDVAMTNIRAAVNKHGIRVAYVDYVQLMRNGEKIRNNETEAKALEDMSSKLQHLALELGITVVMLSQFNRDPRHETPELARLRHSEGIAQAADVVVLIYRPEAYDMTYKDFPSVNPKGTAEFIIAKGRGMGTGKFIVGFDEQHTLFYDLGDNIPMIEIEGAANPDKTKCPGKPRYYSKNRG